MGELYRRLKEYCQSDYYPYHMPGHKRSLCNEFTATMAAYDITEIDGFDNLHDASDILLQLQEDAAKIYGAEESFFLVNGSTAGIISAVSSALPEEGKLLMVRGCHKSVYHAAYLRKLQVTYLWPGLQPEFGCQKAVTAWEVEQALEEDKHIQAVLIVSPTYEGLTADVASIAKTVHKRGIPLIVDEAHGAHLGFHSFWPENSCRQGADLVIQSLHKTLPSLTQTAILHVNGKLIDRQRLKRFLRIYQTSSPSYLFMASMEDAIKMVSDKREALFGAFEKNWTEMLETLSTCSCIRVMKEENSDPGKLVIADSTGHLNGRQLYEKLLLQFHLQMEMAAGKYVLAMFTVGDTKEGYERLTKALLEIDRECVNKQDETLEETEFEGGIPIPERNCSLHTAWDGESKEILLQDAEGSVAAEFVNLYPPGIPLLVPGEVFSKEMCRCLCRYVKAGYTVQGITEREEKIFIKVLQKAEK